MTCGVRSDGFDRAKVKQAIAKLDKSLTDLRAALALDARAALEVDGLWKQNMLWKRKLLTERAKKGLDVLSDLL